MARLNTPVKRPVIKTHEGARASHTSAETQLRRSVLACMLWEDTFYEDGESIADRITQNAAKCSPQFVAELAREARSEFRMRSAPLWLLQSLISRTGQSKLVAKAITDTIQRPDEIAELLAMYWKDGKRPLTRGIKKGVAAAFNKFDEYQFAKWNRNGKVRLKDAMFMCRPNPKDATQAEIFKRIANDQLAIPDTRETRLSSGESAKSTYSDLLKRNKLGYMALLKNLKTMQAEGVDRKLITDALAKGAARSKALPFRFLTAAQHAPMFDDELNQAMLTAFADLPRFSGTTSVLIDVSASMTNPVSERSEVRLVDAAAALAVYAREASENCRVFVFGTNMAEVPNRRGLPLVDSILTVNGYSRGGTGQQGASYSKGVGHGTNIGGSVSAVMKLMGEHDRMIVITDMQSRDRITAKLPKHTYMLNVSPYQHGVGSDKHVTHISGFSEQVMRYMIEMEDLDTLGK